MNNRTNQLLKFLSEGYAGILKANLVGIYLHGSYVLGSYNEQISDLDYLVVVHQKLKDFEKNELMDYTLEKLLPLAPNKGLEFHILELTKTQGSKFPMSFDFHYSNMHKFSYLENRQDFINSMQGQDEDLAAHIMITRLYGEALIGAPIEKVFGTVDREIFLKSIFSDISDAEANIVKEPMYFILNLCRVLAFKSDNLVLSKKAGGQWGLKNLPIKYKKLIKLALADYTGDSLVSASYNTEELKKFARDLIALIFDDSKE